MAKYTTHKCGVKISNEGLWTVCTKCHKLAPVTETGFRCMTPNKPSHYHRVENTHKKCRKKEPRDAT
jgi:hypothetical protein